MVLDLDPFHRRLLIRALREVRLAPAAESFVTVMPKINILLQFWKIIILDLNPIHRLLHPKP